MKKWIGPFLSFVFIVILGLGLIFSSDPMSNKEKYRRTQPGKYQILPAQDENEDVKIDSHLFRILIKLQNRMDEWLNTLNESMEKEDVSLFKVRFLEVLRNILEWGKEKVDAKIESYRNEKLNIDQEKKGLLQETFLENFPHARIG